MPSAPQYQQLQQKLKTQILAGKYEEGALLPSEHELSRLHGINRLTVRHALSLLEQEGYISKHRGKGSVVHLKRDTLGLLSFRGFSEVVGRTEHSVSSQTLLGPKEVDWPQSFFFELDARESEKRCVYLKRLRFADALPVMLEHTYIPCLDLPRLSRVKLVNDSLFTTLSQRYGINIINLEQNIRAIKAQGPEADLLQLSQDSPIIHIYRKYGTSRPGLYLYSSLYCNTETYALGTFIS